MQKLPIVKQKDRGGCGVACVAMLAKERDYDSVKNAVMTYRLNQEGLDEDDIRSALRLYKKRLGRRSNPITSVSARKRAIDRLNRRGKKALILLKRKNQWGGHWVVFDGERIIDPRTGKKTKLRNRKIDAYWYLE